MITNTDLLNENIRKVACINLSPNFSCFCQVSSIYRSEMTIVRTQTLNDSSFCITMAISAELLISSSSEEDNLIGELHYSLALEVKPV